MVRGLHHGRYRALRSTRSRELLTELVPLLLQTLGKTQEPDRALVKFDGFVAGLPAGMQLLSLLYNNPNLLELMAEIMGSAPQLADRLNRNPHLLEAVLAPDFFDPTPPAEALEAELQVALSDAQDLQDGLEQTRRRATPRRLPAALPTP